MKYTPNTLKKLETLFKEADYVVRYGKGNFKAGYAVLDEKRVVVINKFFDTETRISSLIDILTQVDLDETKLTDTSISLLKDVAKARE